MGFMDQFNQSYQQPIPQVMRPQPAQPAIPQITASPFGPQQPDQEVTVGVAPNSDEELFNAFKQNVLNPPQRTQMTYPPNILAGLTKALDVARTPTDYEKNRVFVGGNAYQKAKVFTDTEGKQHFVEPFKQPGFMENVMKAMPEAVSVAPNILNQKRQDELADWDLRNKGYAAAINAEAQQSLSRQREANADWLGQKPDIERDKLTIQRLTAEERVRVSQLKTMTDRELEAERQAGRITLAEYNATQAMKRVEAQQAGATDRTRMTIAGNQALETIRQKGRIELEDLRSLNDKELEELRQDNRLDLESRRQINREIQERLRAEEARKTKAAPGSGNDASKYPTQDRVATQKRVSEVLAANPTWKKNEWITFNEQGFPVITTPEDKNGPDEVEYRRMRDAVFPKEKQDVNLPAPSSAAPANTPAPITAPPITPPTAPPAPAAVKPPAKPAPVKVNPPAVGGGRGGGPAGGVDPKTKENARIQQAATDILRQNNKPVTPANIEWVIKQGMVK